ncbi:MAG: hypothetical protein ILM98_00955 [Kiritimatiellae bacterium]|nr:hypothetical protein [Kiritimatiellia bacterium]
MNWFDWILFAIPIAIVIAAAVKAQRYVHGVADFLSAGRIARRYVLCVAEGESGFGLVTLVGSLEAYYNSGFAYSFWNSILMPIGMVLGLVGFATYRFRETRAMTLGQFFEMRYNRSFRMTASGIQLLSGFLNYAIFPAVSARFLMYFMRLPVSFSVFGFQVSTFAATMALALALACFIACAGGQITIMVTDCIQGILNYPIYLLVAIYLLCRFSWWGDLQPAVSARPEGVSFLNPFDTVDLRDFNLFYVLSGVLGLFLSRLLWGGRGYNSAARNAHESKMAGVLGTWRSGFSSMMFLLVAVVAYSWNNSPKFARESHETRAQLAATAYADVAFSAKGGSIPAGEAEAVASAFAAAKLRTEFTTREEYLAMRGETASGQQQGRAAQQERFKAETADPFLAAASEVLGGEKGEAEIQAMTAAEKDNWKALRARNQTFSTIFKQQRVPTAIRAILPTGLVGLFCALAVFMMLTTDTTYIHGLASVVVQDCVLPLKKTPWTPHQQVGRLRLAICGIAFCAFLFGKYFGQIDFVFMFFAITGALWNAAGPVITLGLYWKRGTTAGAYVSMLVGAGLAIAAIFAQKYWVSALYPWIVDNGWMQAVDAFLRSCSAPFEPLIHWELTADKFPINSKEVGTIVSLFTLLLYVGVSLATCRKPFNMERLLHRGKYADGTEGDGQQADNSKRGQQADNSKGGLLEKLIGIDRNYTRGDRILAWSAFLYSFVWCFCLCFVANVAWHVLGAKGILPLQPDSWWSVYFFIVNFVVACAIGVVSTFWFGICGTRDLMRLFRDLDARERAGGGQNALDDGRVEGHVSLADAAEIARIDGGQEDSK